jgi:tRNA(Arg) A34 adenosine deaminase TadA
MNNDEKFLSLAAGLSRRAMKDRRAGPFGAVVVKNGTVIGEGWNETSPDFDPTAHGEIIAIRRACKASGNSSLRGATIYASCEPCPMCLGAIYWAGIDRLVFANSRWDAAEIGFDDDWLYREVPKPLADRTIPTLHLPNAEAKAVFAEWLTLANKVPY